MKIICGISSRNFYNSEIHYCTCPICNKKFPIARKKSKKRNNGHKKDIWCPFCRKVSNMIETY